MRGTTSSPLLGAAAAAGDHLLWGLYDGRDLGSGQFWKETAFVAVATFAGGMAGSGAAAATSGIGSSVGGAIARGTIQLGVSYASSVGTSLAYQATMTDEGLTSENWDEVVADASVSWAISTGASIVGQEVAALGEAAVAAIREAVGGGSASRGPSSGRPTSSDFSAEENAILNREIGYIQIDNPTENATTMLDKIHRYTWNSETGGFDYQIEDLRGAGVSIQALGEFEAQTSVSADGTKMRESIFVWGMNPNTGEMTAIVVTDRWELMKDASGFANSYQVSPGAVNQLTRAAKILGMAYHDLNGNLQSTVYGSAHSHPRAERPTFYLNGNDDYSYARDQEGVFGEVDNYLFSNNNSSAKWVDTYRFWDNR